MADGNHKLKDVWTCVRGRVMCLLAVIFCSISALAQHGRYVWVPDSMKDEVERVLSSNITKTVDTDEKVIFRGDTIPMVLKDRNLGRYDRGLYNYLFFPKGVWSIGLTASYGEFSTSDMELFSILSDVDVSVKAFSIKPYLSYTIRNNLAVGLRFNYTNMNGDLSRLNVDIDEDMNFNLHDISYKSESYAASFLLTQYIGIGRRSRFSVFNEVQLSFSSGASDFIRPFNSVLKHTHTTTMDARITYSPGVCVLVMKNVSFNLSFGVFGFYLHNEKQTVDGEKMGNRFTSGANFKFNIFNLDFGLAVHL